MMSPTKPSVALCAPGVGEGASVGSGEGVGVKRGAVAGASVGAAVIS